MTTTIGERLIHIRGEQPRDTYSISLGVHKNTIGNYERDERQPDASFLKVLSDRGWNINWVLTGEGAMRIDEIGAADDDIIQLPLYDVCAAAGHGSFINTQNVKKMIPFSSYFIYTFLRAKPADLVLFEIDGDSMGDKIKPGDVVMADTSQTNISGGIYAFTIGDTLMAKYLQRLSSDRVQVSSENKAYSPFDLDLNDESILFEVVGRIVWHSGRI